MSKQPTIPMSPTQLPQQRVYEVVDLPKRPKSFDCRVGLWMFAAGRAF
jgi:hypothetical protein